MWGLVRVWPEFDGISKSACELLFDLIVIYIPPKDPWGFKNSPPSLSSQCIHDNRCPRQQKMEET